MRDAIIRGNLYLYSSCKYHATYESLNYEHKGLACGKRDGGRTHSGPSSVCSQLRSSGTILSNAISISAPGRLSTGI